jgi:hypothetical protein
MKYIYNFAIFLLVYLLVAVSKVAAVCPVCTVAVAAGVGLSRWLGIDDTISGLWVGALTVSLIIWTINWLKSKNIKFIAMEVIISVAYYIMILIPFYKTDIISYHPKNMIWGVDKLLLGMIIGSAVFLLAYSGYLLLKENNNGKAHFPYEKIVLVVAPLIILSGIFYLITK